MDKTIAFIGVGIMGRGLVKNLKKTGANLRIFARKVSKIQDLKDEKTNIFSEIKETVQNADYIIFCLTEDSIVEKAFMEVVSEPYHAIILDFGTSSPGLTEKMHTESSKRGFRFIDSPMTGSKIAADKGEILFMVGASAEDFQNCNFIWEACGKKIIHCGDVGNGQLMKITLNMMQAGLAQVYMEGLILGKKLGLDLDVLHEIVTNSAARSGLSDFKVACILNQDYSTNFSLKNMNKDLNHSLRIAMTHNVSLPLIHSLKSIYDSGMSQNLGEEDFISLFKVNEKMNGLGNTVISN
jgi:3-hydroxyisobutyrate dehydrogenase